MSQVLSECQRLPRAVESTATNKLQTPRIAHPPASCLQSAGQMHRLKGSRIWSPRTTPSDQPPYESRVYSASALRARARELP